MQTFITLEISRQRRDALVRQADEYRLTHPRRRRASTRPSADLRGEGPDRPDRVSGPSG